jgi:branched-chain amino acid transport system substrate-binding protein
LRRALIGLATLATLLTAFYTIENWRGKRAWEQCKRDLAAKGELLDWAACIPTPIPDDENIIKATKMAEWFIKPKPTGNWSNDLLLLMKAAGDSGLKARFLAYWIDQPGNIANAGDTAIGHYTLSTFFPDANGEKTAAFAEDFKTKTGAYPLNVQGHTVHGIWGLGEALKALKGKAGDKVEINKLAFAMEKVSFDTSMGKITMRAEDHQALLPLAVAIVSKEAKFKADNTDKGFKTIKLLDAEQAAGPVQSNCQMKRPKA